MVDAQDLISRDARRVWHPYSPVGEEQLYSVRSAEGALLHLNDADGREHNAIDAMGSWWAMVHGHSHPKLIDALRRQSEIMPHVMFGGLTHEPAVRLAESLVANTPSGLQHVFFSDSGSIAVEIALKMVIQYQAAVGRPERNRMLTVRGGYHGDTFATMSLCDPVDGMHHAFSPLAPQHIFAPRPPGGHYDVDHGSWNWDDQALDTWAEEFERTLADHRDRIGGVILEPVLQGAGGMYVYDPRALAVARRACDTHECLLVLDEIATGFGRTGRWTASEWAGIEPDIMCLGKALTGGTMTGAATLTTVRVAKEVSEGRNGMPAALLHGPTFMGNPMFCAVSLASLKLLTDEESGWARQVPRLERSLAHGLAPATNLDSVADVRVLGAVGIIELNCDVDVRAVTRAAVQRGVWIRPFRRLVYVMPPYITTDPQTRQICHGIIEAIDEVHG
ncbi:MULTISPECIES: adenosylmethionine--8-amino-7-oxononanoate transaminase [Micrococcaceae]|uniref:adenosylmethionine--8-amino-7-oxononanoate transaminase n=1 Tax=unclassified Kocuria TaxID=2649579 RepID=UPI001011BE60|nr:MULTISPECIES: adenosylmethionine--8-amino-7-oxononanoate transaminase [unclassified Kocuria]